MSLAIDLLDEITQFPGDCIGRLLGKSSCRNLFRESIFPAPQCQRAGTSVENGECWLYRIPHFSNGGELQLQCLPRQIGLCGAVAPETLSQAKFRQIHRPVVKIIEPAHGSCTSPPDIQTQTPGRKPEVTRLKTAAASASPCLRPRAAAPNPITGRLPPETRPSGSRRTPPCLSAIKPKGRPRRIVRAPALCYSRIKSGAAWPMRD